MKIAVIGAGAIGSLVAGYLKFKGQEVSLVGHADAVKAIKSKGLSISGVRGDFNLSLEVEEKLSYRPDLVILATKTQDLEAALRDNFDFLEDTVVLTTQNGVRADALAAALLPKADIISSIVMFASTCLEPGKVKHNFEQSWVLGRIDRPNDEKVSQIAGFLSQGFSTQVVDDIRGMKYLKIFVNANNCIPAILGVSMQEAFQDLQVCRVSISIWKEGLALVNKLGIGLVSLPDFPVEGVVKLTSIPLSEAAQVFSGIMTHLSKEPFYGSILQSIKRGKPSEIDYINGEFVRLAKENKVSAPLNKLLVEMVHQVENSKKFFSKEELFKQTQSLVSD